MKIFTIITLTLLMGLNGFSQTAPYANFDASDDSFIDMGKATDLNNIDILDASDKITITMWVRWGDKTKTGVGNWANLFTAADSTGSGDNGVWWIQHNQNNNNFEFALHTSSRSYMTTTTSPNDGVWYHLACTYDGSNMRVYINGTLEATKDKTGNIRTFPATTRLNMGRWPNASNNNRKFDGDIDEVSLWNKALNITEISDMSTNPESVTGVLYDATGLLGYWNFDDNTADDLTNSGNNGSNGSGTTLPIELLSFEGISNSNSTLLNWATASELNNDYFIIERATDISTNNNDWKNIARIEGNGTTNRITDYSYTDYYKYNSTVYYRLKQFDFDGKFTYHKTIAVSSTNSNTLNVYPNPSNGVFIVSGLNNPSTNDIIIYNSTGQIVKSYHKIPNNFKVDISEFPSGIYYIKSDNITVKIIK